MSTPVSVTFEGAFDSWVNSREPVVYHYTSLEAMMNILRTRTIRATAIAYLNDVSERDLLIDIVDERIKEFSEKTGFIGNSLRAKTGRVPLDEPYVTSFSGVGDSLNHWRSYCPVANGVSIGFRSECLKGAKLLWVPPFAGAPKGDFSLDSSCVFKKITYIGRDSGDLGWSVMQEAYSYAIKRKEEAEKLHGGSFDLESLFRQNVEVEASFYKLDSFVSETEYRLMLPDIGFKQHQIEFRCTRSSLVPYVSLSIPDVWFERHQPAPAGGLVSKKHEWNAVAELIIGPTPNIGLTREALRRFCWSIGLDYVKVKESNIPYRDW